MEGGLFLFCKFLSAIAPLRNHTIRVRPIIGIIGIGIGISVFFRKSVSVSV